MSRTFALALLPIALAAVVRSATAEDGDRLDTLVRAYPEELAGHDETGLIWRDGTRMPLSDGEPAKSLDAMLRHGSILDQLRIAYPAGAITIPPGPGDDPGRIRNVALFDKMYGDCRKGEVTPRLVPVVWLPRELGPHNSSDLGEPRRRTPQRDLRGTRGPTRRAEALRIPARGHV